jgi:hypothetical protein
MFVLAAVGAGFVASLGAQEGAEETPSWLHIRVQPEGEGDETRPTALNLPLKAVGPLVAMAPDAIISSDGRLTVAEDHGVSVSDIRTMWQEIMAAGDSEFTTLHRADRTFAVARVGDRVQVRVTGEGENMRLDLPVVVVGALLSGDGETLNLVAAIDELSGLRGDIIRLTDDTQQIRVWVDETAEQ